MSNSVHRVGMKRELSDACIPLSVFPQKMTHTDRFEPHVHQRKYKGPFL